ncbi:MAG: biotin carboxyl carrier protein [Deltaproteobacteria bacterium]|nr:biotin carboxyl carrier protein [Deltaproteobacteria bacterium]
MNEIRFVDTTLRDGQLSLWASNMRTDMMLPIGERLDRACFEAIEIMSSAFYKKCVRDLKEDPWERLRLMSKRIKKTPLRTIRSRSMLAFQISPPAITDLWLERLAANGISEARTSDPSNTASYWAEAVRAAQRVGLKTILNIIYSISPKHTDEYFVQKTRAAAKLDVYRICFKDPGGLLTPEATRRLMPLILREAKDKPVEFHTHCNTGLGALCCLEAIKLGITSINTAIPPLADASSNPSLFNVAMNARALGYPTAVDEEVLKPVRDHFTAIARQEHLPVGKPLEYDAFHPMHQVPGGMISNFRFQLAAIGKLDRLGAVLEEAARVRAELGYPIMVTPYSQFVGVQAAINVIVGERYKEVTDEMFLYALGFWGEEEAQSIEPNLRDRLLGRPRAKELARGKPPGTSLKEFREKFGGAGVSDDEAMLRYFAGVENVAAMNAAGTGRDFTGTKTPLLAFIATLAGRKKSRQIFIRKGNLTVRLEQRQRDGGSAKRTNPRQLLSTSPQ